MCQFVVYFYLILLLSLIEIIISNGKLKINKIENLKLFKGTTMTNSLQPDNFYKELEQQQLNQLTKLKQHKSKVTVGEMPSPSNTAYRIIKLDNNKLKEHKDKLKKYDLATLSHRKTGISMTHSYSDNLSSA